MAIVQVIGLPGAGKTTAINSYLSKRKLVNVNYIDICSFKGENKEKLFRKAIKATNGHVIAESACGIYRIPGYIVKINTPIEAVYNRLRRRSSDVDPDYLSLLNSQMITANSHVEDEEELSQILDVFMRI
jgi:broad-specificity NMP kinase